MACPTPDQPAKHQQNAIERGPTVLLAAFLYDRYCGNRRYSVTRYSIRSRSPCSSIR
jgi:hypothetical protein